MGHNNSDKVPMPRVISMAEEPIVVLRRPYTQTIRPCQWHIARRGLAIEKKFRRGVSPNMIEGVVAALTFNASHQTP